MYRDCRRISVLAFMVLLIASAAGASPIVVDFEGLSDGDSLTNQIPGLTFTQATVIAAGVSLNEFEFPPVSGTNVVFDDGGPIRIDFASPQSNVGGYFTYSAPLVFEGFDAASASLGTVLSAFASNLGLSGAAGSSPNEWLVLTAPGIAYVTLRADSSGGSFTVDNLTYDNQPTNATPVPEPGTIGLVVFGGLAGIRRRQITERRRASAMDISTGRF